MEFFPLTVDHLHFRLEEEHVSDPDWFVSHMTDVIGLNPGGCFVLMDSEDPVGMITTTAYDNVGWLGWLYVSERRRGSGLGARLMQKGIESLREHGCRMVLLEAVPKAIPLYERLGFESSFRTGHWLLESATREMSGSRPRVFAVESQDMAEITEFDRRHFHADRRSALEAAIRNRNTRGYLARYSDGSLGGYILAAGTRENRQVGPFLAEIGRGGSTTVAEALVARVLEDDDRPLYIRCPEVRAESAEIMKRLGARMISECTVRMFLGAAYQTETEAVLSLGCPGKG